MHSVNKSASIVLFLLSLQGFYFFSLGLAPFALLGAFLIILIGIISFSSIPKKPKKETFTPLLFYSLIFLFSIISIFFYNDVADIKRLFAFILVILLALLTPYVFKGGAIEKALLFTLIIHISYFYLQFTAYYLFSIDIDIINLITGHAQKGWGGSFSLDNIKLRRLGGLYNEPGTYATFIAPTLALFCAYYGKSRVNMCVIYLGVLSLILTFSTFALIFSFIISCGIMYFFRGRALIYIGTFYAGGLFTVLPYFLYRFFERSKYGVDTGTEFRAQFIDVLWSYITSGPREFLLGTGHLISDITEKVNIPAALNDSSLFLSFVLTSGPILAIILSLTLILRARKTHFFCIISLLIILLSKASIFWVYTPVLLVLIYSVSPESRKN